MMDGFENPLEEACHIYDGEQAEARLLALRLDEATLRQAVEAGDNARRICGPFHPDQSAGQYMWGGTVAALRELTLATASGWAPDSTHRFETTRNDDLNMVVAVMSGCLRTGRRGKQPRVRRKRGPATRARVAHNAPPPLRLFSMPGDRDQEVLPELWILLMHSDEEAIRCELSRPVGFDGHGHVAHWSERILLSPVPTSGGVTAIEGDDDDDEPFGVIARK